MIILGQSRAAAHSAQANAFLARTSGLDAAHINAYYALIDGLVADGVWALLDALYVFATSTRTTALLSLVSATYNASEVNSPTFTADAGYKGNGSNACVDTAFTPSTATSPNFTQNSSTIFAWCNTAVADGGAIMGSSALSVTDSVNIFPFFPDSNSYYRIQNSTGFAVANPGGGKGLYQATRTGATAMVGYKNGASVGTSAGASVAVGTHSLIFLGDQGVLAFFGSQQCMAGGIGGALDATQSANLYARLHTYLQTIAGIA